MIIFIIYELFIFMLYYFTRIGRCNDRKWEGGVSAGWTPEAQWREATGADIIYYII